MRARALGLALSALFLTAGTPPLAAQASGPSADAGPRAGVAEGPLFVVGGGHQPPTLIERFVELAGGPGRARIAVVPLASSAPETSGREKVAQLVDHGAAAFSLAVTREQANRDSVAALLEGATGIWFTGGDQARIPPILAGTPLLEAIRARHRAGAVVGGTSAGAAIMSDSMLTGEQFRAEHDTSAYYGDEFRRLARRSIEVVPGLGFLSGAIVDQHFIRRERHNRLLSVVLERPTLLGVGIDESTALEVRSDGSWTVRGEGQVVVYDAREAGVTGPDASVLGATGVRVHLLPPGATFDPERGHARLPTPERTEGGGPGAAAGRR